MFHAPYPIEAMTHESQITSILIFVAFSLEHQWKILVFIFIFIFFKNTKYFNTHAYAHTHGESGEGLKKNDSGVYQKGPNSYIYNCVKLNN